MKQLKHQVNFHWVLVKSYNKKIVKVKPAIDEKSRNVEERIISREKTAEILNELWPIF